MPSLFKKQESEVIEVEATDVAPNGRAGAGKGRATPTRREAREARRSPSGRRAASAARPGGKPGDPKAAKRAMRDARRQKAAEYRAAMNSGDISKLPARERAPERIMARDLVDTRRNLGPVLLAVIVVAYFIGLAPSTATRAVSFYLLPLALLGIIVDCVIVGRKAQRAVLERYPNSTVKVKAYSAQRAVLPARWRQPRPRPSLTVARWIPRG
jgi:hypothetical protein